MKSPANYPTSKIFNGKKYYFDQGFYKKSEANKQAKKLRRKGDLARVVPIRDYLGKRGWGVYFIPKR